MSDPGRPRREKVMSAQFWDAETFQPTAVIVAWSEDGKYYRARLPPHADLEDPNLDGAEPHEIPHVGEFFGEWKEGMLEAPLASLEAKDIYIKRPNIGRYARHAFDDVLDKEKGATEAAEAAQEADAQMRGDIAAAFEREAMMYEVLHGDEHTSKHENIATYYGCIREGDRYFSGICLKRYKTSLADFMCENAKREEEELEKAGQKPGAGKERDRGEGLGPISNIIKGVRAGLDHLHGLGYAHNDLTPTNIMIDVVDGRDPVPVLIDFDACGRLGERVDNPVETPGYIVESTVTHEAKKDDLMWKIIQKELEERKRPFSNA
ncbi:hypothetical protein F5I97DRAFT_1282959 [Phlebopus sp. FC_14]|nr:hypothetical protein F5I97DRAFT_1282959 [Phlebopus sp. FC_14]